MIGLKRGTVQLKPYNPLWKDLYKQEEKLLYSLIGEHIVDLQHVGSTSIEGLIAKPIIDMALGVKSLDDVNVFEQILIRNGYHNRGNAGIPGKRILFAKGDEDFRTHYLHIEVYQGDLWKNHLYFRDYLLSHPQKIREYADLKKQLKKQFHNDRSQYTKAKNDFIQDVLNKARVEFQKG